MIYICPECSAPFDTVRELFYHTRSEHRRYVLPWPIDTLRLEALS